MASIGFGAFWGCTNLTTVMMLGTTEPSLGESAFQNNNATIYVPFESLDVYKTAANWNNYSDRIYPWLQTSISGYNESNGNWHFIASPLAENTAPTEIDDMLPATGTYDLYRFDQSENAEWQNYKANSFSLENGQGYLYANAEDVNVIFKGAFNEGPSQEVSLTYDGTADFAGWNLVGNPFPYAATVSRSHYVMNEGGTAIEPVAVSAGGTIAACTGVMVKAEANESNPKVTFAQPTRQTVENKGLLHIAVSNAEVLDKAIVSFNAGDALEKFVFNKDNAQIYIPQDGKDYAIATVGGTDIARYVSTEVPVNFKATKNGTYTLTVNVDNVELDYLHLIDNLTGADIDLLHPNAVIAGKDPQSPAPSYTFTAKTTDYASRFRLVFGADGASGDSCEPNFAYISKGEIIITADACDASLQVVDMMGRVIISADVARNVSTRGMTPGVYVLRLVNGDSVRTQKVVMLTKR